MILKEFIDEDLGHVSYILGSENNKSAVIIDPKRDIACYLEFLSAHNLAIKFILNTHPHADYVGGHLELKAYFPSCQVIFGAKVPAAFDFRKVEEGEILFLDENLDIEVLETPGHTPFCISFLVIEDSVEKLIFSGDALFVGDVGRPDLLGEENLNTLAKESFETSNRFFNMSDQIVLLPTHIKGSFCGKNIKRSHISTLGIEKKSNQSFALCKESLEEYMNNLKGQNIETPSFFSKMSTINIAGPKPLSELEEVREMSIEDFSNLTDDVMIVDLRDPNSFHKCHVKGSINIFENSNIPLLSGSILDYEKMIYLIGMDESSIDVVLSKFYSIGLDKIGGYFSRDIKELPNLVSSQDLDEKCQVTKTVDLFKDETIYDEGVINSELSEIENLKFCDDDIVLIQCKNGFKSSAAVSYLKSLGYKNVYYKLRRRYKLITNFQRSLDLAEKAQSLIPGGSHTYSKGSDQFPYLSPHIIKRGKGARLWDMDGNEFVDWGMALTSTILGYGYDDVNEAVKAEINNGINFTRPSFIEAEVAEQMIEQIPCAEMVKFAKNGSNATTAAVKLARAYTGKDIVLRCVDHPFFSIDDWFIATTDVDSGIPKETKNFTKHFKYNDIDSLRKEVALSEDNIACLIMQPSATEEPQNDYLKDVKELCEANNIILIFDEVVSGFRHHPKGAQYSYGVTPHLSTFGKAMANGFSLAALVGQKDIMELGGLKHRKDRVFLLSTTYGAETHHLRAAQKTIEILNSNDYEVTKHIYNTGRVLKESFNTLAKKYDIDEFISLCGLDSRPYLKTLDRERKSNLDLRTLFLQEMVRQGVLILNIAPSFSHGVKELSHTIEAFDKVLADVSQYIKEDRVKEMIVGEVVKPVFRRYN